MAKKIAAFRQVLKWHPAPIPRVCPVPNGSANAISRPALAVIVGQCMIGVASGSSIVNAPITNRDVCNDNNVAIRAAVTVPADLEYVPQMPASIVRETTALNDIINVNEAIILEQNDNIRLLEARLAARDVFDSPLMQCFRERAFDFSIRKQHFTLGPNGECTAEYNPRMARDFTAYIDEIERYDAHLGGLMKVILWFIIFMYVIL